MEKSFTYNPYNSLINYHLDPLFGVHNRRMEFTWWRGSINYSTVKKRARKLTQCINTKKLLATMLALSAHPWWSILFSRNDFAATIWIWKYVVINTWLPILHAALKILLFGYKNVKQAYKKRERKKWWWDIETQEIFS